ncbi:MAG: VWA domain-containing protein [Candidatus Aminicenantes bacterium]|nr:VWA domain-containing protein [Candidatus Aminicenantes bacterium]
MKPIPSKKSSFSSKLSILILMACVLVFSLFNTGAMAQTEAEILQLLQNFQQNPSPQTAMSVLQHSARVEELKKAGRIADSFSPTLWDLDDFKVDMMKQKISQAGQNFGEDFQMSVYGSDSARPPTRAELTSQLRAENPSITTDQINRTLDRMRQNTRYDVFRSDWDMTFTGSKAKEAGRFMVSEISKEFSKHGITIDVGADLGFNPLAYPQVPGQGYDIRFKYVANQEMYNSRGGLKWIQRQMWNNGKVTYWDSNLGRMVTQTMQNYSGSAKIPFKPPQALFEEELFGFLADNYNQMNHHLGTSKNSAQRLKWMSKYIGRSLDEFPADYLSKLGVGSQDLELIKNAERMLEAGVSEAEAQRLLSQIEDLSTRFVRRTHIAQMELIGRRIANNMENGLSIVGDQKLFRIIEELAGSYNNLGISRAEALLQNARNLLGDQGIYGEIYKALYTALEQAKDLGQEAEILRLIEEHLAAGRPVPVKITRPARPGDPVEAKITSPLQEDALKAAVQANPTDDVQHAAEFSRNFKNSGIVLKDNQLFTPEYLEKRINDYGRFIEMHGIKVKTPADLENVRQKLRATSKAFLDREIQRSWMVRHKQWVQLPQEAKNSTLYTRSFFHELGSKTSQMGGAVKGLALRHKMITGILLVSAAYGWYENGAWGALDMVYESGKAILVFEAINWLCFTGAKKLATATGYGALGPVGVALGILYNVYEIGKLALVLGPVVTDLMNRGIDTFVFDSVSDKNAKIFYIGGTRSGYITGTYEVPGFFNSLVDANTTSRGKATKPEDLFPVFATPEELNAAIAKEWNEGTTGNRYVHMFSDYSLEKMQALALSDWKKSFALKLNQFLKQTGADTPRDEDIESFESTSIEETSKNWSEAYSQTSAVITGLELEPEEPESGEDLDLKCEYVVFGLPGQSVYTNLVLKIISPQGEEEQTEEAETTIEKDVVVVEERAQFVNVTKTFSLDENIDLSRTKFIAELYDKNNSLIDKMEIRTEVIPTEIEVKARRADPDPTTNDWYMDITVKDIDGNLVDTGAILVETDKGGIENPGDLQWEGDLENGQKTLIWYGPTDKTEKATIKITYFGDERDVNRADKKYGESEKTIQLPPDLLETAIEVISSPKYPKDKTKNDWVMNISVKDLSGQLITEGEINVKTDAGGIESPDQKEWQGALKEGKKELIWRGSQDKFEKATITINYLGDQSDPAVQDKKYFESNTTLTLPPDALETTVEAETLPISKDPTENDWKINIHVIDAEGKPVELGEIKILCQDGGIEKESQLEWQGVLKDGKLEITWFGPADRSKLVPIEIFYLGDESDPDLLDERYKESELEIELPRPLDTEITVETKPVPNEPKNWDIDIKVTDELGNPVILGDLKVTTTEGYFEAIGSQTYNETGCTLDNANYIGHFQTKWNGPDDPKKRAEITIEYQGDQLDPNPDIVYSESKKIIHLPPPILLTSIDVLIKKDKPDDPDDNNYTLEISVKDEEGAFVSEGELTIDTTEGGIEVPVEVHWEGALKNGQKNVMWYGPADKTKKTTVTIRYLGDKKDPDIPDLKFAESEKILKLPPKLLKPTSVNILPSLVDEEERIWNLEIEVVDDKGMLVQSGAVKFTATGGSFHPSSTVREYQKDLEGGKCTKAWIETDEDQHVITVKYFGDELDPLKEDNIYEESEDFVKLPPELLETSTVFVIDASGSMSGSKLASAKSAVRQALSGYQGKSNKEEWALYVFFDCGTCTLLQGFTQDPAKITNKLGFGASGGTPIAYSLKVASNYMRRSARGKKGRIILLSDGGESCSGKPVEAAKGISTRKIYFDLGK